VLSRAGCWVGTWAAICIITLVGLQLLLPVEPGRTHTFHPAWAAPHPCSGHKEDVGVICSTGPPCKAVGAKGCTTTGGTACCALPGMACVIPKGSTSGTCTKPPTLTAMPVKGVSTVAVNKVVITTIQLAAKPVASINGGGAPVGPVLCALCMTGACLHAERSNEGGRAKRYVLYRASFCSNHTLQDHAYRAGQDQPAVHRGNGCSGAGQGRLGCAAALLLACRPSLCLPAEHWWPLFLPPTRRPRWCFERS